MTWLTDIIELIPSLRKEQKKECAKNIIAVRLRCILGSNEAKELFGIDWTSKKVESDTWMRKVTDNVIECMKNSLINEGVIEK